MSSFIHELYTCIYHSALLYSYISQTVSFWKNGIFHDLDFHSNWHEFMMICNSIQNQSSLIWDFIQSTPLSPGKWNVVVSPIPFISEFEFNSSSIWFDLRILFILIWTWMKIKKSRIIPFFQNDTVWLLCLNKAGGLCSPHDEHNKNLTFCCE